MAHYYHRDGTLHEQVPTKSKPGQFRDVTIKDARKLGLFPSATTVMQIVSKPGLDRWSVEQGIRAAIAEPYSGEDEDEYILRAYLRSQEYRNYTADFGTAIHNAICNLLGGRRAEKLDHILAPAIADKFCSWLDKQGYTVVATERTVVNEGLRLAGTIDLQLMKDGKKILADLKTQDFSKRPNVYKEHRWQLALYDAILEGWADERHIFYVSRSEIGLVSCEVCVNPSEDDEVAMAVYGLWRKVNKW